MQARYFGDTSRAAARWSTLSRFVETTDLQIPQKWLASPVEGSVTKRRLKTLYSGQLLRPELASFQK
jgi:hypothetical protein